MAVQPLMVQAAKELLALTTPSQVEEFLTRVVAPDVLTNAAYWRPVGNKLSNAGAIEASADEINPLVERIVNSMEAVIELKAAQWRRQHPGAPLPSNPKSAIEVLFGIPKGETRLLSEDDAAKIASDVEMILRGDRDTPTIVIRDLGIGIHPDDFSKTIVGLMESDKGQKPYLVGMYGQGGSSTFDKCEYTIIVSRLHPNELPPNRSDAIGWTVVRRNLATRTNIYSYLVDAETGTVPRFPGNVGDSIGFWHGTHVSHVTYRHLGQFARQQITNYAFYTLNFRLFDPLIPWTLRDERGSPVVRTMRGVPYRLRLLPMATGVGTFEPNRRGTTSVRHNITFEYHDPAYGTLKVEWWILQDGGIQEGRHRRDHAGRIDPYRDHHHRYARRRIAVTRGGQLHAALSQNVFEQEQLRQIARSIIVHVNTDALTYEAGASFFASNRADLKTESEEVVEQAIRAAIETYRDELRAIERERQEEIVRGRGASDEEAIRARLDRVIRAFRRRQMGSGNSTEKSRGDQPVFHGREIPTYLQFARNRELGVRPLVPTHMDLLTDAADQTVKDPQTNFRVISDNGLISTRISRGNSGRWTVEIICSPDAPVGMRAQLSAFMERSGVWRVETKRPARLIVAPPPPPYKGNDPPTYMRFRSQGGRIYVSQGGARITLQTDAVDDLFARAKLHVTVPNPIEYKGCGDPRRGEIRLNLRVPDNMRPGVAGRIDAILTLPDGSRLLDSAVLIIEPRIAIGGTAGPEPTPDYRIFDVRQFPIEGEKSWADMKEFTGVPWNSEDVAAYYIGQGDSDDSQSIFFFLNADNREMQEAERGIARRKDAAFIDAFRQYHRTFLCYHLYQRALGENRDASPQTGYEHYRDEMIRLNRTLLYAQRELRDALFESDDEEQI